MAIIKKKKITYKISAGLTQFLLRYNRYLEIPIHYKDLTRYESALPLYDHLDEDTLWKTVIYSHSDRELIYLDLKKIYAILKASGDTSVMKHLYIERVDICTYGNTQPFRVRVVNKLNDNFDYFYIKQADASRVYGLELEDILSPNRISYLVHEQTLIEEHISGLPGDQFIKEYLDDPKINKIRMGKEFVKFNERCFVRLLGDMHSSNYVVVVTPDFEETDFKLRAIDFDQQSYEGRKSIYLPQYFKQNNPIIKMGIEAMIPETVNQYKKEERSMMGNRLKTSEHKISSLLRAMKADTLSTPENINTLKNDLADYYKYPAFLKCKNMGEILETSLSLLFIQ
ncbi:MAG: hypothetical protein KTR26_04100 [Flammeovirgaceae bacterium]|nr:hypothetical protein [Flammeovirgaceae bacterium]